MSKNYLPTLKLQARIGASLDLPIRVETGVLSFATITAIARSSPLVVTAPGHGIPPGWRAAIVGAKGLTELNVPWDSIGPGDMRPVSIIDADTIAFDGVSGSGFGAYTTGGVVAFYAPKSLSAYTGARMDIKDRVGGKTKVSLNSASGTMQVDTYNSAVHVVLGETTLSAVPPGEYVFDVELIRADGVDAICSSFSSFLVVPEVTTST